MKSMRHGGPEPGSRRARNWSQLPTDLLVSVLSVLEIPDLFASAAACTAWRAASATVRRLGLRSPNQSPYLVYSSADRVRSTATLHNLSTGRRYHAALPDPPFRSRYIVGSSRGWLVTADERSILHLLNPVTGAQVALPPPESMIGISPSFSRYGVLEGHWIDDLDVRYRRITHRNQSRFFRPKKTRVYLYEKAVLSSDPSSGDCIVLLKHRPWGHLSFARVGDSKWTWLNTMGSCDHYHDFFYNDQEGLFYAVRANGDVHTIDLSCPRPVVKVIFKVGSGDTFYTRYLVRSPWGDLLQVLRLYGTPPQDVPEENHLLHAQESAEDEDGWPPMGEVTVYKVDLDEQKVTRIKNLQDHVLFIGFSNTFMLQARDFPNLTPNCVYMTDDNTEFIYYNPCSGRQLACVNLEDGSFSDLSVPNSQLDWPPPVWFRPSCSLHK